MEPNAVLPHAPDLRYLAQIIQLAIAPVFLLAGLGALTLALTLIWLTVPGWTYNFADGRTYVLDALGQRLGMDITRFFSRAGSSKRSIVLP